MARRVFRLATELSYRERSDGGITVRISVTNGYDKSMVTANRLGDELMEAIPFEYTLVEELTIDLGCGSSRRAGMLSIEAVIKPRARIGLGKALDRLKANGFERLRAASDPDYTPKR